MKKCVRICASRVEPRSCGVLWGSLLLTQCTIDLPFWIWWQICRYDLHGCRGRQEVLTSTKEIERSNLILIHTFSQAKQLKKRAEQVTLKSYFQVSAATGPRRWWKQLNDEIHIEKILLVVEMEKVGTIESLKPWAAIDISLNWMIAPLPLQSCTEALSPDGTLDNWLDFPANRKWIPFSNCVQKL